MSYKIASYKKRPREHTSFLNEEVDFHPDGGTLSDHFSKPKNELSFRDLSYKIYSKEEKRVKVILNNVCGHFSEGINAIMGPSGSGKTSLLDVLSERISLSGVEGEVLLDGEPTPPNFQLISGYVVQDDVVMGTLTVRENLLFSANLRLPSDVTQFGKEIKVDRIINQLGLENCADSLVGTQLKRGVSGGERKRCNVGTELLTNPRILFLDEPTTGLDASTSFTLTTLLDELARENNMTVIMSIHQPRASIFKQVQRMSLLSQGNTVFHGDQNAIIQHFAEQGLICEEFDNPADFLLDIVLLHEPALGKWGRMASPDEPGVEIWDLAAQFKKSSSNECVESLLQSIKDKEKMDKNYLRTKQKIRPSYQTGFFTQLYYLVDRGWKNNTRNPMALNSQIIFAVCFALIMAAVYASTGSNHNNPDGFLDRYGFFMFISQNIIYGSQSVLEIFRSERILFLHERSNGFYRSSAYFISKLVIECLFVRSITIIIYSLVTYWVIGLVNDIVNFAIFFLCLWTLMFAGISMLLCFTISFDDVQVAQLITTIPTLISAIFSGLFINIDTLPTYLVWLPYVALGRYPMKILSTNEMAGLTFYGTKNETVCDEFGNCAWDLVPYNVSGSELLEDQAISSEQSSIWYNEGILAGATVVLFLFSFLQITQLKKRK